MASSRSVRRAFRGGKATVHEYSIVQELVARVEGLSRQHHAQSVRRLVVRIGELSGVETSLLSTAYETFRERTCCEAAELSIEPVRAQWVCPRCERAVPRAAVLRCVTCGEPARLVEGDEIVLARIEMEVD
jgi:hydrogenase nickel incorporation protein HypA/HybF